MEQEMEVVEATEIQEAEVAPEPQSIGFTQELKNRFIEGGPGFMGIVLACLILGLAIARQLGLKGYKYLDEAIELSNELGCPITDAEIIRVNSSGLTIYNPKNLADRIKGMKNKKVKTKAEKIAERLLYEKELQDKRYFG